MKILGWGLILIQYFTYASSFDLNEYELRTARFGLDLVYSQSQLEQRYELIRSKTLQGLTKLDKIRQIRNDYDYLLNYIMDSRLIVPEAGVDQSDYRSDWIDFWIPLWARFREKFRTVSNDFFLDEMNLPVRLKSNAVKSLIVSEVERNAQVISQFEWQPRQFDFLQRIFMIQFLTGYIYPIKYVQGLLKIQSTKEQQMLVALSDLALYITHYKISELNPKRVGNDLLYAVENFNEFITNTDLDLFFLIYEAADSSDDFQDTKVVAFKSLINLVKLSTDPKKNEQFNNVLRRLKISEDQSLLEGQRTTYLIHALTNSLLENDLSEEDFNKLLWHELPELKKYFDNKIRFNSVEFKSSCLKHFMNQL